MEQDRKLEQINLAIQKLIEDKRGKGINCDKFTENNDDDGEYRLALSRLLSELEMSKGDGILEQSETSSPPEEVVSAIRKIESEIVNVGQGNDGSVGSGTDEIIKELKKVRRQNFVTHCLLSVMIVLTVAWQLSEVSLVLKVKDGLSHPFRSFGSMLMGMLKGPNTSGQEADNKERYQEPSALPPLNIREMPHMDISNLGLNHDK